MDILKGYRTYIMGAAIILHQVLIQAGVVDFESTQIEAAINVILAIGVILFRKFASTGKE